LNSIPHKARNTDRRKTRRLVSTVPVEVVALATGMHFSMHLSDVAAGGCFVHTSLPFAAGARVHVRLSDGLMHLETEGRVVYSQSGSGMGITFDELDEEQRLALIRLA
jgi:hypothetical protein